MVLENQVAIVTGGGQGIGKAIAVRCASEGANIAVFDVNADEFERLDVLVNNAGIEKRAEFLEITPEDWQRQLDVNLSGTFYCTQAAAREMSKRGYGRIVNVSQFPQNATAAHRTDGFRPKEKARLSSSGRHFPKTKKQTSTRGAAYESILEIWTRSLRRRWSSRSRSCSARVRGWGRLCRKARGSFKHLRDRRSVPTVQGDDLSPHSLAEEPVRDDQRLGASVAGTPRPWRHSGGLSATEPHLGAGREAGETAWEGSAPLQRAAQGQEQGPRSWS
ncbi:MAG: SDR family NAD(P)-dependent oxidoreductase [Actinobacteria bacterium]|nr:MAG: SDR family NAD(P)-dependent oxidoreductase [Actinomycetota bacterium]